MDSVISAGQRVAVCLAHHLPISLHIEICLILGQQLLQLRVRRFVHADQVGCGGGADSLGELQVLKFRVQYRYGDIGKLRLDLRLRKRQSMLMARKCGAVSLYGILAA